jgi:hypothetical protein
MNGRTWDAFLVMHRSGTPFDDGSAYFIPVSSLCKTREEADRRAYRNNPMFNPKNFEVIEVTITERAMYAPRPPKESANG